MLLASPLASRDTKEFAGADEVHLDRGSNRHLAFGAGPHRCLGSHLARLEMRVALTEFHRAIPDYELDLSSKITYHAGGVMGMDILPLRWPAPLSQAGLA